MSIFVRWISLVVFAILLPASAGRALAQEAPAPAAGTLFPAQQTAPLTFGDQGAGGNAPDPRRACDGCPPRSVGRALFQTTGINVLYGLANLARKADVAYITPKTWWANMQQGFVWDLNNFGVNQIGHPYQGSNYFTSGRANGLSFYESAALTAFGSATWEYFGETAHPSLNDFLNTTLGGIGLGEMFHRAGWLIRDTRASGKRRFWSEIAATVADPITGANRFRSGDVKRLSDKPSDMVPTSLSGQASLGVLWRGTQSSAFEGQGDPFLEVDGYYGNANTGRSRTPYDAFWLRLRFGGGSAFSDALVRGRLYGQPLADGRLQFSVLQSFTYQSNDAYSTGSQRIDVGLSTTAALSKRNELRILGWGGLTILGAVDSLPLGVTEKPEDADDSNDEGPRYYDYGPGSNFGTLVRVARDNSDFFTFFYVAHHLYSLDGVRANHFLQQARADLLLPIRGRLGLGVAGEYFSRQSFYQDALHTIRTYRYPQVRVYLTWGNR